MQARLLTLPKRQQILLGTGIVLLLVGSFMLTDSLIPLGALLAVGIGYAVIRNPVWSIFAFIIINVFIALRVKDDSVNGAPSTLDVVLGIFLVGIIGYWVLRLRILERQELSLSVGQLLLSLFIVWSVGVTIVGLYNEHNSPNVALREILNLSPLLILPLLYERFIEPGSKVETALFAVVIVSSVVILIGNILELRSHLAHSIYLYQIGRATYDLSLTMFVILIMTSSLMHPGRWWQTLSAIGLLLLGIAGLFTTFSRNSYISTPMVMIVVLWLGKVSERRAGMKRLTYALCVGIAMAIPIILSSRLLLLILLAFATRLLSAGHYQTDLSLQMRYGEWRDEWHAILQSPLFGHGFGTPFRTFAIAFHSHVWMSFSHSSYLYIVFKTGFIGALFFFSAYFVFMSKGFKLVRNQNFSPRSRVVLRASFAFLIIVLFQAYLGAVFDTKTSMMWLGLVWGYFLAIEKQDKNEKLLAK